MMGEKKRSFERLFDFGALVATRFGPMQSALTRVLVAVVGAAASPSPWGTGAPWSLGDHVNITWTLSSMPFSSNDTAGAIRIPASVPGDVNADLVAAGVLPDYWRGSNSLQKPWWVPQRRWTYSARFPTPAMSGRPFDLPQAAELRFLGCDYNCTFALNGRVLGTHFGSFTPAAYEVSVSPSWASPCADRAPSPPPPSVPPTGGGAAAVAGAGRASQCAVVCT